MLGFIVGTICLVLLIRVAFGRRWHHGHWGHGYGGGYGGGCGHHGYGGRMRGYGPRAWLWGLMRRLDATPAQEKLFRDEALGLWEAARNWRERLRATKGDLAGVIADDTLDKNKLDEVFKKHDEVLAGARQQLSETLGRLHATLDAAQRRALADMIISGRRAHC